MGGSSSKSKAAPRITPRDRAILELKVQRDRLKQYQKKISVVIERETEAAKQQLAAGNKDRALLALRRKKYQQTMLDKTFAQLLNLEQLTSGIEFALVEQQVFAGLKTGNAILADLQSEMKVEEVEQLMSDTAEAIAYQDEISQMLSGKMTEGDEADVLEELDELVGEVMGGSLPDVPPVVATKKAEEEPEEEAEQEQSEAEQERNEPMLA